MVLGYRCFLLPVFLLISLYAKAQEEVPLQKDFVSQLVTPALYRDVSGRYTIDSFTTQKNYDLFTHTQSPHLTLGFDQAPFWLYFSVNNTEKIPKTCILRFNRTNFTELTLWLQREEGETRRIGSIKDSLDESRIRFVNGFYFPVTFQPGINRIWIQGKNEIGLSQIRLSLHSPDNFSIFSRQTTAFYGLFGGIALLSVIFAALLYWQNRNPFYLIYICYISAISMREMYANSIYLFWDKQFLQYSATILVAATYSSLFRRFTRMWEFFPRFDRILQYYAWGAVFYALLVWVLAKWNARYWLEASLLLANLINIVYIIACISVCVLLFRKTETVRIILYGSIVLALAFLIISLRSFGLIPNYPFLQFAIAMAFLFEILVFTVWIARWFAQTDRDRQRLQIQLDFEQREKVIAIEAAEQRVKDQIARDLHDDIAASLSGIRILSQVGRRVSEKAPPEVGPILEQIALNAQSTLDSLGDIIWAIKPHPDYLNDMADRMRELTAKMLGAGDIQYALHIPRSLPMFELNVEARRNVYLIFKEALHNVVKHSQGTRVSIRMELEKDVLYLDIEDDGVGFDPATAKKGNGLHNMEKRAMAIGGSLAITSAPGRGTRVYFRLPILAEP